MGTLHKFIVFAACCILFFPGAAIQAGQKQADTIDELLGMFDESSCMECHEEIHAQWSDSWHSKAVVSSLGGMHNFIEIGLKKEWEAPLTKGQLLKCLDCHAPIVNFASEELAVEIGEMIVTAFKEKDSAAGKAAKEELAKLNVGCLACHNIKATEVARGYNGPAEENMIYGPRGDETDGAHETLQSDDLTRSAFCMQCHGIYKAADGETINCNTLSGSYLNSYVANGGSKTCQDCHLEKGHLFPGGHDIDTVRQGLGLQVEINPYQHLPGKIAGVQNDKSWVPSAVVTVFIDNRSGHRIPDG